MFCKIRKGKKTYSIYACNRQRVAGKVVSHDIKLCDFAWHSLYEDDEEINGLIEAFKMLSMKHHPDRGGSTEKMVIVNSLKEKIIK